MSAAACMELAPAQLATGGLKRGLVVDGDPGSLAFAAAALRQAGYAVLSAGNAQQALSELLSCRGTIEFAITDGDLEGARHAEVVASVRALFPDARILTTTRAVGADRRRAGSSDDVLYKPFTAPELIRKVGDLLGSPAFGCVSNSPTPNARVGALAVGSGQVELQALARIFARDGWVLRQAATLRDAVVQHLREPAPVILAEKELPDGGWLDLLRSLSRACCSPRLIVASRHADERLWAEVLNLGGFDVVSIPFETREIRHVVSHAWDSWQDESAGRRKRFLR